MQFFSHIPGIGLALLADQLDELKAGQREKGESPTKPVVAVGAAPAGPTRGERKPRS